MKFLYCHDNFYMETPNGNVYSAGQFPYSYFYPFLQACDELRVVARAAEFKPTSNVAKLNIASGERVSFRLLPNINSPMGLLQHYETVKEALYEELQEADGIIIRAVSDMGWLLYNLAKQAHKPIAMEMAACAWDSTWNHGSRYGKIYAPIRHMRDKIITRNADYVTYVCKDFLPNRYPTNGVTTFASNVRIDRPQNEVLKNKIDKIKHLYDGDMPITIGLIGNLNNKLKGVSDALHAIRHIEQDCKRKIHLRVLGPGTPDKFKNLEKALNLQSSVSYDGLLKSGSAVLEWLDNIDIYIQPSYQEGVPRATIEAMSRANPTIGSTAGGIPELLPDEWLHAPGNIQQLAVLLRKMIDSPLTQIDCANQNFEKSIDYSSDILMPRRIQFWNSFANFISQQDLAKAA